MGKNDAPFVHVGDNYADGRSYDPYPAKVKESWVDDLMHCMKYRPVVTLLVLATVVVAGQLIGDFVTGTIFPWIGGY